jgi:hypothetical protein
MGRECRRLVALRAISLLRSNGAAFKVKRTPAAQKNRQLTKDQQPVDNTARAGSNAEGRQR